MSVGDKHPARALSEEIMPAHMVGHSAPSSDTREPEASQNQAQVENTESSTAFRLRLSRHASNDVTYFSAVYADPVPVDR